MADGAPEESYKNLEHWYPHLRREQILSVVRPLERSGKTLDTVIIEAAPHLYSLNQTEGRIKQEREEKTKAEYLAAKAKEEERQATQARLAQQAQAEAAAKAKEDALKRAQLVAEQQEKAKAAIAAKAKEEEERQAAQARLAQQAQADAQRVANLQAQYQPQFHQPANLSPVFQHWPQPQPQNQPSNQPQSQPNHQPQSQPNHQPQTFNQPHFQFTSRKEELTREAQRLEQKLSESKIGSVKTAEEQLSDCKRDLENTMAQEIQLRQQVIQDQENQIEALKEQIREQESKAYRRSAEIKTLTERNSRMDIESTQMASAVLQDIQLHGTKIDKLNESVAHSALQSWHASITGQFNRPPAQQQPSYGYYAPPNTGYQYPSPSPYSPYSGYPGQPQYP